MIDLNRCKRGDLLLSTQGEILEYICKTPWKHYTYLDHVVRYTSAKFGEENYGTRTNEGFVFKTNRKPKTDNDIECCL